MNLKTFFLLVLTFLIFAGNSQAETGGIQFSLAPTIIDFNYKEFDTNGETLNREDGLLAGIDFDASLALKPHVAALVHFGFADGLVDYDGQTQGGSPHRTKTNERLLNLSLGIRRNFTFKDHIFRLSFHLTRHRWERDIKTRGNVSGLFEVYQWSEAEVRAQLPLGQLYKGQLSIDYAIFRVLNPTIEVNFRDTGLVRLDLGEETGHRFALNWVTEVTGKWTWGLTASYVAWGFGRSASTIVPGSTTSILEPRSESRQARLQIFFIREF